MYVISHKSCYLLSAMVITHSRGNAGVVRTTTYINGQTGYLTPRHAQTT